MDNMQLLVSLYGIRQAEGLVHRHPVLCTDWVSRRDSADNMVVVGLYPDQFSMSDDRAVLRRTLALLDSALPNQDNIVKHVLPPFVSDWDDRFSIVEHCDIDPQLGTWQDFEIGSSSYSMLDFVCNQVSTNSALFQSWITEGAEYAKYFIQVSDSFDISRSLTPRRRSPFREFVIQDDRVQLWSSHGGRQVDLNYRDPAVFELALVILERIAKSVAWVRFDGIAYSWKESGSSCVNLPEARILCRLLSSAWRGIRKDGIVVAEVDDLVASYVDGSEGPDLTYNYAIPPAVTAAVALADSGPLGRLIEEMGTRTTVSWINCVSTHDGISLRPWSPVISTDSVVQIANLAGRHGIHIEGYVDAAGQWRGYELDMLTSDFAKFVDMRDVSGVVAVTSLVNSLILALRGVPYLFAPSMLGFSSRKPVENMEPRNALRFNIPIDELDRWQAGGGREILWELRKMIRIHGHLPALRRASPMRLRLDQGGVLIFDRGESGELLCVYNFTRESMLVNIPFTGTDLLRGDDVCRGEHEIGTLTFRWILRRS